MAAPVPQSTLPLNILIVEDHNDTRVTLQMYLEVLGHTVVAAATVREALTGLSRPGWDVLIADLRLPDGSGSDVLTISGLAGSIYSIAISGYCVASDQVKREAAGFRRHLAKPFHPEDLEEMLEEAARERGQYVPS